MHIAVALHTGGLGLERRIDLRGAGCLNPYHPVNADGRYLVDVVDRASVKTDLVRVMINIRVEFAGREMDVSGGFF